MTTLEFRARQRKAEERDAFLADVFASAVCVIAALVAALNVFEWVLK